MSRREMLRERLLKRRGISGAGPSGFPLAPDVMAEMNIGAGGVPLSPKFMAELDGARSRGPRMSASAAPQQSPPAGAPAGFRQPPPGYTGEGDLDPSPGLPGRGYIDPAPAPAVPTMGRDLPPAEDTIPPDPRIVGEGAEQPNFTGGREYGLGLPEMAETETPIVTNRGNHPGDPVPEGETDPRARMKDYLSEQIKRRRFASPELLRDGRNLQGENGVAGALSRAAASFGQVGGKGPVSTFDVAEANSGIDATIKDAHLRDKGVDDEQDRAIKLAALRQRLKESKDSRKIVPPGSVLVDENNQPVYTAPNRPGSERDTRKLVPPGAVLVDENNQPVYTSPNRPPNELPPVIDPPNKAGESAVRDRRDPTKVIGKIKGTPESIPEAARKDLENMGDTYTQLEAALAGLPQNDKDAEKYVGLGNWAEDKFIPEAVGNAVSGFFGQKPADRSAEMSWRLQVQRAIQAYQLQMTGQAGSDKQYTLLKSAMPGLGDNPRIFREKAAKVMQEIREKQARYRQSLITQGYAPERIGGAQPAPKEASGGNPPPHGMRVKQKGVPFIWNGSKYVPE